MFGNVRPCGLDISGKYRNISMQHTCSRHAAWDLHTALNLVNWTINFDHDSRLVLVHGLADVERELVLLVAPGCVLRV